nr:zinc finger protein 354C-like [Parasteatoda tepidariorum]
MNVAYVVKVLQQEVNCLCTVMIIRGEKSCSCSAVLSVHSGEKPYSCSVCNKSFSHKQKLAVLARPHTGEKLILVTCVTKGFRCDIISPSTVMFILVKIPILVVSTLPVHNRVHTDEKPYFSKTNLS